MKILDKGTSLDLVKLIIFIVVTSLATGVLIVLIANITFEKSQSYKAVFANATDLIKGDDIRIAGVKVGSVEDVQIYHTNKAMVTFSVADSATVTRSSQAMIKYRNLVGQRYIALTEGVGNTSKLPPNSTIPESRTQPALDLTELFNGFKPLFAALTPTDINKLSYEIIQVFQGEGGNLQGLLQETASITNTLATRDQVIGSLIDNLNSVLATVNSRNGQLNALITQFQSLLQGLVQDRNALLSPLNSISVLAEQTASLTKGIRPSFVSDLKGLRKVTHNLRVGEPAIDNALQILPIKLQKIGRTAIYGSYFNFYLCQFIGQVDVPKELAPLVGLTGKKSLTINYPPENQTLPARCSIGPDGNG